MKATKIYTLIALLMLGGVTSQAQVNEPVEILPSSTLIVYHMDQWSDNQIILNAVESGVGLYAVIIDEEGNIIDYELWHVNLQ